MTEDLRDTIKRLRLTPEAHAWLKTEARLTGKSLHDIVRDELHERALLERRRSTLLDRLWPREGTRGTDVDDEETD